VDYLLGSRILITVQKSSIVDTEIPIHEAKLFKEEEERNANTFIDVCPCSIQVDLDLQVI
jgi:hypothetical protein